MILLALAFLLAADPPAPDVTVREERGVYSVSARFIVPQPPSIVRDVSLLVDRKVTVAELLQAANDQKVENCLGAKFVGTYEGEGIPEGKRSVAIRLEYRADDRTLRDEDVDGIHWPLVKSLQQKFDAEVR